MVLRNKPFTHLERFWCWAVAIALMAGSAVGIVIAFQRQHWPLGSAAIGAGAIGALYARAAKLGRPLREWWR
jgi:cytochrome bd-type quinol oxidase subunit 1